MLWALNQSFTDKKLVYGEGIINKSRFFYVYIVNVVSDTENDPIK